MNCRMSDKLAKPICFRSSILHPREDHLQRKCAIETIIKDTKFHSIHPDSTINGKKSCHFGYIVMKRRFQSSLWWCISPLIKLSGGSTALAYRTLGVEHIIVSFFVFSFPQLLLRLETHAKVMEAPLNSLDNILRQYFGKMLRCN